MKEMVFTEADLLAIGWSGADEVKKTCPHCREMTTVTSDQILGQKEVVCEECRKPFKIVHDVKKIA